MAEHIDREVAVLAMHEAKKQDMPLFNDGLMKGADIIISMTAADVVEVVRCYECTYHDDDSQYHYCRKWRRNCPNDSEFFCKWGKRKDGGQDDV